MLVFTKCLNDHLILILKVIRGSVIKKSEVQNRNKKTSIFWVLLKPLKLMTLKVLTLLHFEKKKN